MLKILTLRLSVYLYVLTPNKNLEKVEMIKKDTICPAQVVTMAKRERIVPTKLS